MTEDMNNTKVTIKYFIYLTLGLFVLPFTLKQLQSTPLEDKKEEVTLSRPPLTQKALPKTVKKQPVWVSIQANNGDTLTHLFKRAKLSNKVLHQWLATSKYRPILKKIAPKQTLSFIRAPHGNFEHLKLSLSEISYLDVFHKNDSFNEDIITLNLNKNQLTKSFTINESLLAAANEAKLPKDIIYQLIAIFKQKVDFSRDIRQGDSVSIIYESQSAGDKTVKYGPIIAATIQLKHKRFDAIHYTNGLKSGYYQPNGQSLALGFDRYPVKFSHVGSVFNLHRYHPILHITRAHRGIDLAAPLGTPIKAVADGIVTHIGPLGGFGNMVKVKHSGKYETIYAHMLRFKHGLKKGSKILRGSVIGYVGETGLATAPHCHFEFHINGRAVNPATVQLPTAGYIANKEKAAFQNRTKQLLALLDDNKQQA